MYLATAIDYFSYLMLALTVGLILFKSAELWFPQLVGAPTATKRLTMSGSEFDQYLLGLESGLTALAVISSTAPFIGLMGTVLHIMDALSKVSTSLDTAVISGPIATALNATLVGLASAVPASAAHAFFQSRLNFLQATKTQQTALSRGSEL